MALAGIFFYFINFFLYFIAMLQFHEHSPVPPSYCSLWHVKLRRNPLYRAV
jgi:hypothetical protein